MAQRMALVPAESHQSVAPPTVSQSPLTAPVTSSPTVSQGKERLDAEVILSTIPKNYRNRARALMNHITADPQQRLQWNERGELIYHDNVIPGSHITDLLKNYQIQYKHSQPVGQKAFRDGLKELNIPIGLLESRPGPPGIRLSSDKKWLKV